MQQTNDLLNQITPYLNLIAPYMVLAVYAAGAILAIAVLAFLMRVFTGTGNGLLKFASRLLIFLGIVFLIYQVVDMAAVAGQAAKFYQQPFWLVAVVLLVPGILFRIISALRPTHE